MQKLTLCIVLAMLVAAATAQTIGLISPSDVRLNTVTTITISGSSLGSSADDVVSVTFTPTPGSITACNWFKWFSPSKITCNLPEVSTAAQAIVTVTLTGGAVASTYNSVPLDFSNPPTPAISTIDPTVGDPVTSYKITLTGTDFGNSASDLDDVSYLIAGKNVRSCTSFQYVSVTKIFCWIDTDISAGQSAVFRVTVNGVESTTSTATFRTVSPPVISRLTPRVGSAGADRVVTLMGDFPSSASLVDTVKYGASGSESSCSPFTYVNFKKIMCNVVSPSASFSYLFRVCNTLGSCATSTETYEEALTVTLTSISPLRGSGSHRVTITGTNFGKIPRDTAIDLSILAPDTSVSTASCAARNWLTPSKMTCTLPGIASGSKVTIRVYIHSQTVSSSAYEVLDLPTIDYVRNNNAGQSDPNIERTVTVYGSNFGSSADDITRVSYTRSGEITRHCLSFNWIDSTTVTCHMPTVLALGSYTFAVVVRDQQTLASTDLDSIYTVRFPPSIDSVYPPKIYNDVTSTVTLTGDNFGTVEADVDVWYNVGQDSLKEVSPTLVSSTKITVPIPSGIAAGSFIRFKIRVGDQTLFAKYLMVIVASPDV